MHWSRRPICMRIYSAAPAQGTQDAQLVSLNLKIGRSGVRRSSGLGPDRLGHARAFRLGTRTKFKPPVLWLTNLEARPHNSIYISHHRQQPAPAAPRQPSGGRGHAAKGR
eukprot:scaffold7395_cov95-Isochrysis_galbana.AAC.3